MNKYIERKHEDTIKEILQQFGSVKSEAIDYFKTQMGA